MEHIISKIIEIEKNAQKMIMDAQNEQNSLPHQIDEILNNLRAKSIDEMQEKIKAFKADEEKLTAGKLKVLVREHDEKIEKLKKIRDKYIDEWINIIYNDIVVRSNTEQTNK